VHKRTIALVTDSSSQAHYVDDSYRSEQPVSFPSLEQHTPYQVQEYKQVKPKKFDLLIPDKKSLSTTQDDGSPPRALLY